MSSSARCGPGKGMACILELARHLQMDAIVLRRYGDERMAAVCEVLAGRIAEACRCEADTLLSLREAAAVGGYSADHLGRLIRDGKVPNAGRKHVPRIRRADIPIKTGFLPKPAFDEQVPSTSTRQIVRAVANSVD